MDCMKAEYVEVDCGSGVVLKLNRIEPGSFMMGAEEGSESEPINKYCFGIVKKSWSFMRII